MDDREKRLRMATARIEDDVDSDWLFFDDRVDELEAEVEKAPDGLMRDAAGFVVVQVYLHRMRREWEDLAEANGNDSARNSD